MVRASPENGSFNLAFFKMFVKVWISFKERKICTFAIWNSGKTESGFLWDLDRTTSMGSVKINRKRFQVIDFWFNFSSLLCDY